MKVLAINSSARKDGNTALLISTVLEELNKDGIETEMIQLAGKVIEPCKACWACGGRKNCVHKKDLFQEIYEKMVQADGIILGSPVYTANISANMQAFLERASVVADMNRSENLLRHKVGAAVTAARRGGALNTLDAMNHFFMLQDMFIVGSSYWPMAYGRMPGEVQGDQEGLETMRSLGRNMAYLLKALNTAKEHKDTH
ncbi:flavodoxin family protein [Candidatus Merdisoma sp. JLR.KK006]|uniref:flavodoxin family protein n=1 Tax=Candidatus Merdisoma sp. JLR.KK006 TaxID=3112626 RepID=UPI002FF0FFD7